MTNVEALRALYAALGGDATDVANESTIVQVLNAIAAKYEGENDATQNAEAIVNIAAVVPSGSGTEIDSLIDKSITSISNDTVTTIGNLAFANCTALRTANFPNVTSIGGGAFEECSALGRVDLGSVTSIGSAAFRFCENLKTLIIRTPTLAENTDLGTFSGTAISEGTGYIYVPDDLVDEYKSTTAWTNVANQIKPISELEE